MSAPTRRLSQRRRVCRGAIQRFVAASAADETAADGDGNFRGTTAAARRQSPSAEREAAWRLSQTNSRYGAGRGQHGIKNAASVAPVNLCDPAADLKRASVAIPCPTAHRRVVDEESAYAGRCLPHTGAHQWTPVIRRSPRAGADAPGARYPLHHTALLRVLRAGFWRRPPFLLRKDRIVCAQSYTHRSRRAPVNQLSRSARYGVAPIMPRGALPNHAA